MTTLSQSVQEAIQQGLPGLVAGELKTFIANAEQVAKDHAQTLDQLKRERAMNAELNERLAKHRELDDRENELGSVAEKLQAQELALLKREARLDADVMRAELNGVKDTVGTFLRNVTVRQTVVEDVTKPVAGSPGGNGYQGSPGYLMRNCDNKPDTTTKTETKE